VNAADDRLKILHLVSATAHTQQTLVGQLTSLVTRTDRTHVTMQVVHFAPGTAHAAVLRQAGVPVHELELSRKRFAVTALSEVLKHIRNFAPDVIHAWGHTAQLATRILKPFAKRLPPVVWTMPNAPPLTDATGFIDRRKVLLLKQGAQLAQCIVYPTSALAAQYRRLGFPDRAFATIAAGVDIDRYKIDGVARQRLRKELKLEDNAFVIGMLAPFMPEYDYPSFVKATAEIIKYNPDVNVLIAGRGAQRGNAGVMALLGGGTLATRTTLLGEWSDLSALFNTCDVMCSSALNDSSAMTLATAMLCGVPCVGTGKGAQGEVLSQHGIAIEPGSPNGLIRGITRVIELTPEKRAFMTQNARQHIVNNYSIQGSIEKYLGVYLDLTQAREAKSRSSARAAKKLVSSD
jgi:glycosyltransferase involved in cell wall biosynthesis